MQGSALNATSPIRMNLIRRRDRKVKISRFRRAPYHTLTVPLQVRHLHFMADRYKRIALQLAVLASWVTMTSTDFVTEFWVGGRPFLIYTYHHPLQPVSVDVELCRRKGAIVQLLFTVHRNTKHALPAAWLIHSSAGVLSKLCLAITRELATKL